MGLQGWGPRTVETTRTLKGDPPRPLGMSERKRVLVVVTSADRLDASHPTGLWLEEFAIPYAALRRAGHEVVAASVEGGAVPIDPASEEKSHPADAEARAALETTLPLAEVDAAAFDAVYFPGGHGTMVDFANRAVGDVASLFAAQDKPIAAVCHGPAALVAAVRPDGRPLVAGRRVAGFTNEEERESELEGKVPFLLESRLRELGAQVETRPPWSSHVVKDGGLITGQNPQSSAEVASALIEALERR